MRKIGLQQSFTGLFPDSGNIVSITSLVIKPPKTFMIVLGAMMLIKVSTLMLLAIFY
jgi:hypothetical protein